MIKRDYAKPILLTLILANPAIIFLLTGSISITLLSLISVFVLIFFLLARNKNAIPILLLNFISLFSILIYAEVVFKYGFSDFIIENLYEIKGDYYFNKPFLEKKIEDKEYSAIYKTNISGYRIPTIVDQNKKVNNCDWLFIGDSFTQGAQVEYEDLYTSYLYKKNPDKIIVNAGISGFGIGEELSYYKTEGYKLKPQKVILQLCSFNDFMNVSRSRNKFSDYLMEYSDLARFVLYNLKYKPPGELPLGRWTEPFHSSEEDNREFNIFYKNKSTAQIQEIELFKYYLSSFKREVEKNGSELIVFLIPTKEQTYSRYFNEVINSFNLEREQFDMEYPNNLVSSFCDSMDIKFVDCLDGFQTSSENVFFEYDEHLNPYGHYALAEILKENLIDSLDNGITLITESLTNERYPSCSKNNIFYQGLRNHNMELFMKDIELKNEIRLTYNDVDESHPVVNRRKNLIAFTEGNQSLHNTKVALLDLITFERSYLNSEENIFSSIPDFSDDGNFITYVKWEWNEENKNYTIPNIVMNDLSNLNSEKYITQNNFEDWRPVFSPDGNSIAFISKRKEFFDLYLVDIISGKIEQLTNTNYDEWDPSFSSDGTKIIFSGKKDENWDLFEIELATKKVSRITNTKGDEWDAQYCGEEQIIYAGEFGFFSCIYEKKMK